MPELTPALQTVPREILDILPFAIHVVDIADASVLYANEYCRAQAPCHLFKQDAQSQKRREQLLDARGRPNGQTLEYEFYNELDERWYQIREQALYWNVAGQTRVAQLCIASDIGALKETQNRLAEAHAELILKHQELERIASTDPLTQINNREKLGRVFIREMQLAARDGAAFSVVSVDLDHFKQINDTFGHAAGDSVLIHAARAMKQALRETDHIGRWGGEEFLVLCPQTPSLQALGVAERIRAAVVGQSYSTGQSHSASLGVATFRAGDTLDTLLQRADQALYRAKQAGRNRVCTDMDTHTDTPPA